MLPSLPVVVSLLLSSAAPEVDCSSKLDLEREEFMLDISANYSMENPSLFSVKKKNFFFFLILFTAGVKYFCACAKSRERKNLEKKLEKIWKKSWKKR